jgi:hypothetical protein
MVRLTKSRRQRRQLVAGAVALAAVIGVIALRLTTRPEGRQALVVLAVDRTASVNGNGAWPEEVAAVARETVVRARENGATRLVVIGVGSNVADTAKATDVNLAFECQNPRRCGEDLDRVAGQVSAIAARLAQTPPTSPGTDVVAALVSARDLCGDHPCEVVVASDLEDSRLADPQSPAVLANSLSPSIPSFAGIPITLVGLGADGAPTAAVSKAETFFHLLLSAAGSTPVITRNL